VDTRGELLLNDQFGADYLAVVSKSSGPVWSSWLMGTFIGENLYYNQIDPCAGAPTSRLQPYSFAVVTEGAPNNVRKSPSKSAALEGKVSNGTLLLVDRTAPVCSEGLLWWRVEPATGVGPRGWTAEGSGSDYWLAPLK
jgi:hypothetical protein